MDEQHDGSHENGLSRRELVTKAGAVGAGFALADLAFPAQFLRAATDAGDATPISVGNPLARYPDRDWERVYRDQFREEGSFVFTCAPNDTHNCLLRAHMKNGVVVRISATYGYGKAKDLLGNQASHRWDPRICQKGLVLQRRQYGDRRLKGPTIRRGFKAWVDAGFPRKADGTPEMDTTLRGKDSWLRITQQEAFDIAAKTTRNIAETYTGDQGKQRLLAQGYDPDMVAAVKGAGTQVIKMRGGMPLLGVGRVFGFYRFANMLALLDEKLRPGIPHDQILGSRAFDNYAWHTDLPPGHPMVSGSQTVDVDLFTPEYSDLVLVIGMNWICTKMPDSHWLTEARLKGKHVVVISADYQPTANKADDVILLRPGTDPALMLGLAREIIANNLYDRPAVLQRTDLPFLVRMDTGDLLGAKDVIPNYTPATLTNYITQQPAADLRTNPPPPPFTVGTQIVASESRAAWGDFMVWDLAANKATVVTRDQVGAKFTVDAALEGTFEVVLANGQRVSVRPLFDLLKQYLDATFDLATTAAVTEVPEKAITRLARLIAANKGKTLFAAGMGPNHYFNGDIFGRTQFLVAALTDNIGHLGGNVSSYAGNYRGSLFQAIPQWIQEDPFQIELDFTKTAKIKRWYVAESAHYWNYGDRQLRVGNQLVTGKTHTPTPTKMIWFGNSNSLLGNAKWSYDVLENTLPKQEAVFCNEWWWTNSCENSDLVFAVDSWLEMKLPDMTASCTNPFLLAFPATPLPRLHDTVSDYEALAGVAKALGTLTGDGRYADYWKPILEQKDPRPYLQRVLNGSNATRGIQFADLEQECKAGVPMLMNNRTYPRSGGWEQRNEDKPWYTRTGRLEFMRPEAEFRNSGEVLPVFREPIDATKYEGNVILSNAPHPLITPKTPEQIGISPDQLDTETRQYRNVVRTWSVLKGLTHPLTRRDKRFRFIFQTPKYRWGAHTTAVDTDWMAMLFGPFGDIYRSDPRAPWASEAYAEINPEDAKEIGVIDGDYVWVDADPEDRPYRGAKPGDSFMKVARVMLRARVTSGMPRGVVRTWFNMYASSTKTVLAKEENPTGPARNEETGYVSLFRHGSHQSGTRAWLRPTQMTDSMTRKNYFGHQIGAGFEADVHSPSGAPKEAFVRVTKAESGAPGGHNWRPYRLGLRPQRPSADLLRYVRGAFVKSGKKEA